MGNSPSRYAQILSHATSLLPLVYQSVVLAAGAAHSKRSGRPNTECGVWIAQDGVRLLYGGVRARESREGWSNLVAKISRSVRCALVIRDYYSGRETIDVSEMAIDRSSDDSVRFYDLVVFAELGAVDGGRHASECSAGRRWTRGMHMHTRSLGGASLLSQKIDFILCT